MGSSLFLAIPPKQFSDISEDDTSRSSSRPGHQLVAGSVTLPVCAPPPPPPSCIPGCHLLMKKSPEASGRLSFPVIQAKTDGMGGKGQTFI